MDTVICDNCHYLKKSDKVDDEGCIHISWHCEKRDIALYYQVIRSDRFLERTVGYERITVLFREKVDKCSKHMIKSHKLTDYV